MTLAWVSHLTLSLAQLWFKKRPRKEVERKYYIKLAQFSECRASERVTKSLSRLLLEVVTMKAVNSDSHSRPPTLLSQPNHFSLTCSFVHLPKCKISSEQRSQNVNKKKKKKRFLSHRLFTHRWKLIAFILKMQNKRSKGLIWMHATTFSKSPAKEHCPLLSQSPISRGTISFD